MGPIEPPPVFYFSTVIAVPPQCGQSQQASKPVTVAARGQSQPHMGIIRGREIAFISCAFPDSVVSRTFSARLLKVRELKGLEGQWLPSEEFAVYSSFPAGARAC